MRFIGSKALLLKDIEKVIQDNIENAGTFCDIFAGTSTVGRYFKKNYTIISNDLLHFSYVLQKATIEINQKPSFAEIQKRINRNPFEYLLNTEVDTRNFQSPPFIYENYSPNKKSDRQYFTNENALRIDFIRQTIEQWRQEQLLNEQEYHYLLAALIEGVPFVSNIAGTYGAFLKHWDKRAFKKFQLIELDTYDNGRKNTCYNQDSNRLIREISGDILYIDTPYNQRQYAPNYHILETISRYDYPEIKGKTGLRPYQDIKSEYCVKNKVLDSFNDLVENAKFKHLIVSYSNEGIMAIHEIEEVLKSVGKESTYRLYKIPYRRYKHRSGNVEHNLHELLFYIEKG
jgi:adenine-specific DNA-methyltransferase